MENIHHHFSEIAHKYRDLRTTDLEPIIFIKKKLKRLSKIEAADIGCGTGRYSLKLFRNLNNRPLNNRLYLYCVDTSKEMLGQSKNYLIKHKIKDFETKKAPACDLPIKNDSLDCVFSFNAIHHFNLPEFLNEVSRVLKDKGYLFIYTRLKDQNEKNIWGKYFPMFNKKETRLYKLNELKKILRKVPELKIESTEFFKYNRINSMDRLLEQAENHHYSTFYLYNKKELRESFDGFKQNLQRRFKDLKNINWSDENILLVVRKEK